MAEPIDTNIAKADTTAQRELVQDSNELHKAVNTALKNEEGGATVHVFNPEMSAEAKKAEAMKNVQVPQIVKEKDPLATDIGSTDNQKVAEALAKSSSKPTTPQPTTASPPSTSKSATPGSFVQDALKPGIPDWYKVGWTGFSKLPNPGDEKAMAEFSKVHNPEEIKEIYSKSRESNGSFEDDFITQFIDEKYFGEWYHNCGVVFVAIFFTWLLIKLRFGLFACFITGAFFGMFVTL
jgi:Ca2+-dependent lipid-binding protein